MTTPEAEKAYQHNHTSKMHGKPFAVFNPHNTPVDELPVIYGFNNGGSPGWYIGQLISEDGYGLGSHCCSHECYMEHDLGILEGTRPDRHETFQKHYPDGYRMEFVGANEVKNHPGIEKAYTLNQQMKKQDEQS